VPNSVITLTTDFGEDSPYVAAMKGVILGINPDARLVDLSHQIPPQDIRHTTFFLRHAVPYFPPGVVHLVVVDPGVGSERALLYVDAGGHRLVVPDNGCWTDLAGPVSQELTVIRLAEPSFWRHPVSSTFHGRDILAPVAAHLSRGVEARQLGPVVDQWVRLTRNPPVVQPGVIQGEVIFVDHFGNLITNIPAEVFGTSPPSPLAVEVGGTRFNLLWVKTYADAAADTLVGLISSSGTFEVAAAQGNAARRLGARIGSPVKVFGELRAGGGRG
jgi:S-adenosylmethionine hydrolase